MKGIADTTHKMGKLIDRFNKKAARVVNEIYDFSPADRENDAKLIEPLTDRFLRTQNYLSPYFTVAIDDIVRDKDPRPYVEIHLVPQTARGLQVQEIARKHRFDKMMPLIPYPLTVFFYFQPPSSK